MPSDQITMEKCYIIIKYNVISHYNVWKGEEKRFIPMNLNFQGLALQESGLKIKG